MVNPPFLLEQERLDAPQENSVRKIKIFMEKKI